MPSNSYIVSLTRNVFSQTLGQIISLLINLFAIALAARYLGVTEFGLFNYLLAIIVILTKIMDLGIAPNIFREYSIQKKMELLNTGILIRILAFLIIVVVINLYFFLSNVDTREIILSNVLLINLIISSKGFLRELIEIPFKVDLIIHLPITVMLLDNIIFLFLVLIMPYINSGIIYFAAIYTLSNLPGFIIMLFLIEKKYGYRFITKFTSVSWLIKNSFPLFVYTLFNTIFLNIDLLLLKKIDSVYSAGIYSAASRITMPMLIIPIAFIHSVFPKITTDYHNSTSNNFMIKKFLFKTLFLFSFTIAAIISFKSTEIITFLYGISFSPSGSSLTILLWSQIFLFNSFLVINLLVAYNKQTSLYLFSITILISNVILNFILIPEYSFVGASYAKLFSNLLGFLITSVVLYNFDRTIYLFEKGVLFFSMFALGLCFLLSILILPLYLILTSLILLLFIIFIKFYSPVEIKFLLKLINKEKWYGTGIFINYSD
jgi:O-antigen/teichoic acid export membrane protein